MKLVLLAMLAVVGWAQPTLTVAAKGPNQIDLHWTAVANPGYGYVVEIQSSGDSRYSSYTVLRRMPDDVGYACDPSLVYAPPSKGGGTTGCTFSDVSGQYVYNLPIQGHPYWVTESQYVDPIDDSPAQAIAHGLIRNTTYNFRVRTYTGDTGTTYGAYSNVASATTPNYAAVFISTTGNDSTGDGSFGNPWKTFQHAMSGSGCGVMVIAMAGNYGTDKIQAGETCANNARRVVMANPGDTVTITMPTGGLNDYVVGSFGTYFILDGITIAVNGSGDTPNVDIWGQRSALFGCIIGPTQIPSSMNGVHMHATNILLYGNLIHNFGSPYDAQNGFGASGEAMYTYSYDVIWNNHLTRNSHDSILIGTGSQHNKALNNVTDGGWGMYISLVYDGTYYNLVEGGVIAWPKNNMSASIYKPCMGIGAGRNTFRRNVCWEYVNRGQEFIRTTTNSVDTNDNIFYNNTYIGGPSSLNWLFQSSNFAVTDYNGHQYKNNIGYGSSGMTEIYWNSTGTTISYNLLQNSSNVAFGVQWWINNGGNPYISQQLVSFADANYGGWSHNADHSGTTPVFVNAGIRDYHLSNGGSLPVGTSITDPNWPLDVGGNYPMGAYGIPSFSGVTNQGGGRFKAGKVWRFGK